MKEPKGTFMLNNKKSQVSLINHIKWHLSAVRY